MVAYSRGTYNSDFNGRLKQKETLLFVKLSVIEEGVTLETSAFYPLRWLIYVFNSVVNTKLPAVIIKTWVMPILRVVTLYRNLIQCLVTTYPPRDGTFCGSSRNKPVVSEPIA